MDCLNFIISAAGSAVGAFVGFFLALISNRFIRKQNEQKDMKMIWLALVEEIKKILSVAKLVNDEYEDLDSNKFYYPTTVWQTIISSGSLLKLYSKKHDNFNKCIRLYSIIDCANLLEQSIELCHYSQQKSEEILRLKKRRLDYVNQIFEIITSIGKMN